MEKEYKCFVNGSDRLEVDTIIESDVPYVCFTIKPGNGDDEITVLLKKKKVRKLVKQLNKYLEEAEK